MVKKSENYKSSGDRGPIINKASLLLILDLLAFVALVILSPFLFSGLPRGDFSPMFFLNYFPRQELAFVLMVLFVLVTAPLPLLIFYTPIHIRVSNRYENHGEVWSLIKRVVKQNYRRNIMFILAPALSMISVLLGSLGFIVIYLLVDSSSSLWVYISLIIFLVEPTLLLPLDRAENAIIQEIKNIP
ncbi:MAG: hypothetical protein ACUVXA_18930 [Candidatus Jordarchaeum sp.]|uniref:hypothetical protein n=1 Tax=Candidatus Jordarchaeum sp. TaxID=2823881 RepID=UPI00404B58CC